MGEALNVTRASTKKEGLFPHTRINMLENG